MLSASSPARRNREAGFTLVELLVVTAIISVLAGMLLPALEKSLAAARQIACLNREKQCGLAINLYANDYSGLMLMYYLNAQGDTRWTSALRDGKYLAGSLDVLLCPSGEPNRFLNPAKTYGGIMDIPSGMCIQQLSTIPRWTYLNCLAVPTPEKFVLLGDNAYRIDVNGGKIGEQFASLYLDATYFVIHLRHGQQGNFQFLDGHATACHAPDLRDSFLHYWPSGKVINVMTKNHEVFQINP